MKEVTKDEETVEEGGSAACEGWKTLPEEFVCESIRSLRATILN